MSKAGICWRRRKKGSVLFSCICSSSAARLGDFVACWFGVEFSVSREGRQISAGDSRRYNRFERIESERFKSFTYEELTKRDKLNLDDFVACWFGESCTDAVESAVSAEKKKKSAEDSRRYNRFERVETERFKSFTYEELTKRDKLNLDD